ncbi:MSMEG_1061 family FMN-dependent PPOX-type flavoprotein [Flavivirga abyssicola]|uniref:MSMEG_1061 family FMN-dependent PPOX-type flavoprotein n=1 Tax=Flavivirga abyssicola TaxID=3063533 RepID=UPI0026DF885E|nr:MSMEG_1061 family FMN-dependent PPOX-type flavoprotein [Flavivirga sp. MEBiC07777]WVK12708.1 MSMEG_1061 family FMN-dependent PPOX-type flavoprotein [Flavivirga sp. MEBiC07777]
MQIKTELQLRELYGFPKGRSKEKILSSLEKHAIHFIETSPFLVMSTCNSEGKLDASPRGGTSGFVKVTNSTEIVIPDAKGNNIVDSIGNIVETGMVGLLFLIPGVDETLRINGQAIISIDTKYLELFTSERMQPKACIVITIEEVFLHCAKAFMRSKLWDETSKIDRNSFPTMGQMLKDQLGSDGAPESREDMIERYKKDL